MKELHIQLALEDGDERFPAMDELDIRYQLEDAIGLSAFLPCTEPDEGAWADSVNTTRPLVQSQLKAQYVVVELVRRCEIVGVEEGDLLLYGRALHITNPPCLAPL
ncbi:MAG: hypothetical protein AAFX99_01030 [Myxococcota bacterium]